MKKNTLFSFFLLFSYLPIQAKGIDFFWGSWNEAIALAKKQNKIIFVDAYATWCGPCKVMANQVFVQDKVGEKFNASFINLKIDAEKGEGKELAMKYGVDAYPTYLFIHPSGELIYKAVGSMSAEMFIMQAERALETAKTFRSTNAIEEDYQKGNRNGDFLLEYIKKKKLNGEDVSALVDDYLKTISEADYKTEKVLNFIAENNTSIFTKGFDILIDAQKRVLSMTKEQGRAVIRGISTAKRHVFSQALKTQDKALLEKLIGVVKNTSLTKFAAEVEENQFRYEFAKKTKDVETLKSLIQKDIGKLMAKTDIQLKKEDEQMEKTLKFAAKMNYKDTTSAEYEMMTNDIKNVATKSTAYQLNNYAWDYYQLVSTTPDLEQALLWANRATELQSSPANLDTKAHLLYKLGKQKEAIRTQKEAIKAAKKIKGDTKGLETVLKSMKKQTIKFN